MNFKDEKKELIKIIECFLESKITINKLQNYAWDVIDKFSDENQIPGSKDVVDKIFWFAIWQIQHLASEEHFKDGTLERELKKTLEYLLDPTLAPSNIYGIPPQ